jgi:hypothetical protein
MEIRKALSRDVRDCLEDEERCGEKGMSNEFSFLK